MHTPPLFCAQSDIPQQWREHRNMDARINTADDSSTSEMNQANCGPLTSMQILYAARIYQVL